MKFTVQLKKLDDQIYFAICPELPCCFIQARSEQQAISRIHDAIKLNIISYKKHFEKVPLESSK